jgi:uncharacterized membrane protein YgdD (TMEM256/DUF423 family)
MNKKVVLSIGAVLGALAVILGAFGAHALKETLTASGKTLVYDLAVRYQFYHVLAILITGLLMEHHTSTLLKYAAVFFLCGIVFFSGSLYVLALTTFTFAGPITPVGGAVLIAGWLLLLAGVVKKK